MTPKDESVLREAGLLSRYLIGKTPSGPIAERYAHAVDRLFKENEESRALRLARRAPRLLPCIDAACGLFFPDDPLRKRLLVMAAVLETTPEHADYFLPRHLGRLTLVLHLAWYGGVCLLKVLGGLLLLPALRNSRSPAAK